MKYIVFIGLCFASVMQASDIFLDIHYNDNKAINTWLKSKPDVTIVNQYGQTILIKAVQAGNKSLVSRLLNRNVNVNHVDEYGKTALDYAAELHHKKIVLKLVKHKAVVTTQENMIKVRQIIKSRYRLLKAIAMIFGTIAVAALFFVIPAFYGHSIFAVMIRLEVAGITGLTSLFLLIPAISWKDRIDWYCPSLIVN